MPYFESHLEIYVSLIVFEYVYSWLMTSLVEKAVYFFEKFKYIYLYLMHNLWINIYTDIFMYRKVNKTVLVYTFLRYLGWFHLFT